MKIKQLSLLFLSLILVGAGHVNAAPIRFAPFEIGQLKLTSEESFYINNYYGKFDFFGKIQDTLLGEIKARTIGKYSEICGKNKSKWQKYQEELYSSKMHDASIRALISETNAHNSLMAYSTLMFRETIKSEESRRALDELKSNDLTKSMFFAFNAGPWFRSYADSGLNELADEFLSRHCGANKK